MKASQFLYRRPETVDEAVSLLAAHDGEAQILAGGQSLMPTLNMRLSAPGMLVDINRIEALRGITPQDDGLRIGALVRHVDVLESDIVRAKLPLLQDAVHHVAHMAVRNRGTTCGSLALADPSAEMPALAVLLDATIRLDSASGARAVPARAFFEGLYQTVRRDDEMISEVVFPTARPDDVFRFAELSRRHGDFAVVGAALRARRSPAGLSDIAVVIFGSEPAPLLSTRTAGITVPRDADRARIVDIAHAVTEEMEPIENHQGRAETKRQQTAVLLTRMIKDACHG